MCDKQERFALKSARAKRAECLVFNIPERELVGVTQAVRLSCAFCFAGKSNERHSG